MIRVPDDLFRDCVVHAQVIGDVMLAVARLFHEGRLLGATVSDYDLAISLLQQAISAQVAQKVIWQACLDEDKPEGIQ